jgi:hypothetical protein
MLEFIPHTRLQALVLEIHQYRFALTAPVCINVGVLADLEQPGFAIAPLPERIEMFECLQHCLLDEIPGPVHVAAELVRKILECLHVREGVAFEHLGLRHEVAPVYC